MPTWNGQTGELIKNIPLLRMYRLSRRKFRALTAEGITVEVTCFLLDLFSNFNSNDKQYGKVLKDISYSDDGKSVTATFADGSTATGSLLVGADGAQSAVRTSIFGAKKAKASSVPYSAVNLHVKYGDVEKALFVRKNHPIMTHAIHPDGYWLFIASKSQFDALISVSKLTTHLAVQDVPDPNDPATWTFQLQTTWNKKEGEDPSSLALLKEKAQTFGEPFKSANLWVPDDTKLSSNNLSYWKPIPWDDKNGRVTLVGDAAHPMTFRESTFLPNRTNDVTIADLLCRTGPRYESRYCGRPCSC
jgi:2-polyprenyl-6-methoxyphenol hydroxylase-like FAD-dependent oxidoreductase